MKKLKLISKLFGVIALVAGLGVGVYLVKTRQFIGTRANPQEQPKEVKITNLTENSFTISWTTDAPTVGSIAYSTSPSNLDLTALEDRASTASTIHHISLKPLKPATAYFFEIISGGARYDNSGQPYEAVTPQALSVPPPPETIYGSILNSQGVALRTRAVVYVEGDFTPMSALVNPSGNYSVSVSTARSKDLSSYANLNDSSPLQILVVSENGQATATTTLANASPVPTISIGQTFDLENVEPDSFEPKTQEEKEVVSKLGTNLETPPEGKFSVKEVETPKEVILEVNSVKDGEVINNTKPNFNGKAPPNTKITITLQSDPITVQVTTDENGNWNWTPPVDLEIGSHLIKVAYASEEGNVEKTVNFKVGESPLAFSASDSATLAPSPSPIVSPTPTATPTALPDAGVSDLTYFFLAIAAIGFLMFFVMLPLSMRDILDK